MSLISADRVTEIFLDCLFKENELKDGKPMVGDFIPVEGVVTHVGFHPGRIHEYEAEILVMLMNLPITFRKSEGGGWTFLNAYQDLNNEQWTGLHKVMDQLLCLGLAIKRAEYMLPRELWAPLPGGVPYFCVIDKVS